MPKRQIWKPKRHPTSRLKNRWWIWHTTITWSSAAGGRSQDAAFELGNCNGPGMNLMFSWLLPYIWHITVYISYSHSTCAQKKHIYYIHLKSFETVQGAMTTLWYEAHVLPGQMLGRNKWCLGHKGFGSLHGGKVGRRQCKIFGLWLQFPASTSN